METIVEFDLAHVEKLLDLSRKATERRATFDLKIEAFQKEHGREPGLEELDAYNPPVPEGVILVKDQGAYLMSNCSFDEHPKSENGTSADVAYAKGMKPADPNFYDNAREVFGGDDFAMTLPGSFIEAGMRLAQSKNRKTFQLKVSDESFSVC